VGLFTCKHKLAPEVKDGYQFCEKCGKAFPVECDHVWTEKNELRVFNRLTDITSDYIYIRECTKCGEIKTVKAGLSS
jgi:hypothetical protein